MPLRGGQSAEHRILHRGIRSGTPLELLETNEETGYSLVRMEDGLEGWLQTQYLVDEPIARDLLDETREELLALEAEHQQSLLRIQDLQDERDALQASLEDLRAKFDKTSEELENIRQLAADVIHIDERNQQLMQEREALERQIDELLVANDRLQDTAAREWFIRGGALVLVTLIIGFWVGRRIYHRRDTGGWG